MKYMLLPAVVLSVALSVTARAQTAPAQVLQTLTQAADGSHWHGVAAIVAEGREHRDGLECHVHSITDLRDGWWRESVRCPDFVTAQGIDARGAWRQDRSGQVHPLDSPEARTLATTDRWLNRRGPFVPGERRVALVSLPARTTGKTRYLRVEATPPAGRSVVLWIGGTPRQLARTVMRRSFQRVTTTYGDYRDVRGRMLPFRITSAVGADAQPDVEIITHYRLLGAVPAHALERPDNRDIDTTIPAGGVRIPLDFSPSGKLVVEAWINRKGPFPFVLDTGGHAILTPATARALGLKPRGGGVSYGAGAGSRPVSYARVHSIGLGDARIDDQSVLVMGFSPVLTDRGDKPPIAGLLGLEVFERFVVTIDPAKKQLILQPFKSFTPPAAAAAVPIRFTDDMPLVRARLDGKAGIFGIDTGNSGPLMLFPDWAQHSGLSGYYEAGLAEPDGGVGGTFMAHMAYIRSLEVGGLTVPGPEPGMLTPHGVGATSNPSEAGNLGMSVWRAFRVTLDYRDQRLYLSPRQGYAPRHPTATGGFRAVKLGPKAFTVVQVAPDGPAAESGLRTGDRIVAVDGIQASRLASLYLMVHIARSTPGTRLTLTRSDGRTLSVSLGSNAAMEKALRPRVH